MNLSCCIWAVSGNEEAVLQSVANAGFAYVDIRPDALASDPKRAKARELGLGISCVAASFGMPEGAALDAADNGARERALAHTGRALAHAAGLGATAAYVVPGKNPSALDRYAGALRRAADEAASLGLKLCVEHFPGGALPTVAGTLDFLRETGHPNLYLLFDIGHAQMSNEDPAEAITRAGNRLGYVHLDDNDGANDLHWSLTDGVLTETTLRRTFAALARTGYEGAVSLELSPKLDDPLDALKRSREVTLRAMG